MFTGLVQQVGIVLTAAQCELAIQAQGDANDPWKVGESVAVNGCCLTIASNADKPLRFQLSEETLRRTSLGQLNAGSSVNLERALKLSDRLGGHVVQGHVDTTGHLIRIEGQAYRFKMAAEFDRYLVDKGSIAVDGVSLTIVGPETGEFDVHVIPHTLSNTTLGKMEVGQVVNIEFDVLAKYVEKLTTSR